MTGIATREYYVYQAVRVFGEANINELFTRLEEIRRHAPQYSRPPYMPKDTLRKVCQRLVKRGDMEMTKRRPMTFKIVNHDAFRSGP